MPDIHASFTNREVLDALRKAGWGHLLPPDDDLENPDEVCVEFTTSTDDPTDEDEEEDEEDPEPSEEDEEDDEDEESCEGGRENDEEDDEEAVEPEKFQQIWDSLDD